MKFQQRRQTAKTKVLTQNSEYQASFIVNVDEIIRTASLVIEKVIECPSEKNKYLLVRLVNSLSQSQFFIGTALYLQPNLHKSNEQLTKCQQLFMTQLDSAKVNPHRICYSYQIKYQQIDCLQTYNNYFKKLTNFVHNIIQNISKSYRSQNKCQYLIRKLEEALKTWYESEYEVGQQ